MAAGFSTKQTGETVSDKYDEQARELLPCRSAPGTCLEPSPNWRSLECPALRRGDVAQALRDVDTQARAEGQPIDILLFCPQCGEQHIDESKPEVCETCGSQRSSCCCAAYTPWLNPPHKSHRCAFCNHVWRPADVATNGVQEIFTKGSNDGNARPRFYCTAEDFNKAVADIAEAIRALKPEGESK